MLNRIIYPAIVRELKRFVQYNNKMEIKNGNKNRVSFSFVDYDCIGFDLDNTICKYKIGSMVKMEYEILSKFLIENRNYPSKHLQRPIEDHIDFLMKGLILDFRKGNILKISSTGEILKASHGTKYLTQSQIKQEYGESCHWAVTDTFINDTLATWNGPLSEEMRSLLDYFDMPAGLVFARLIDTIDEISNKKPEKYNVWPDILSGLIDMFDFEKFHQNSTGYFAEMKTCPLTYIEQCDPSVNAWLRELRSRDKFLFLMTGSYVDFASLTSETCLGRDWKQLFDLVIFYAKKPGFFTGNRPFIALDGTVERGTVEGKHLARNGCYVQGNWKDLYEFLAVETSKEKPRVAYVGDNLIQDIFTPAVYTNCDTVAVVEELQAERVFNFDRLPLHSDFEFITSERWGSFFTNNNNSDTIWTDIIRKYAKLCVPNMSYITSKPVDFKFSL